MASAHWATISFLLPFANVTPTRRRPLVFSYISTPSPSNLTKRKNYLRPKLIKTLKILYPTPLIPQETLTNPIIPIESPHEQQSESPSEQFSGDSCPNVAGEEPKESESSEIRFSESSDSVGVLEGSVPNFSTRSVLKIGLYLVGAFVFQTICAVWIFGSANSDHQDGNLDSEDKTRVLELGMNRTGEGKSNFVVNGKDSSLSGILASKQDGIIHMDEYELKQKIVEIREMAREARERERLESKVNAFDDGDDDAVVKTGIEKEVDNRLVKLRKRLENDSGKLAVSSISDLNKNVKVEDGLDKDSLDAKEAYRTLMFKKKYKFRGPSPQPGNKPKGFQGSKNGSTKIKNSTISASEDQMKEKQLDLPNGKLLRNNSTALEEEAAKKTSMKDLKSSQTQRRKLVKKKRGSTNLEKKVGVDISKSRNGAVRESGLGRPSVDEVELTETSKLEAQNSQENQDTTTISNKRDVLSDGSRIREVGRRAAGRARDNKSYTETDLWWCSLPYVLAILMRRGHDGEGPRGLFNLNITSRTKDEDESSHIVAFEDRGDATNFCYLLQSFFEDLGDFSVDIVPLLTNELIDDVKSHGVNVVVVKKGQLQLYAGQPLADVEMALRSLVR